MKVKKDIDVTFPEVLISVNGKCLTLASTKVTTKDISSSISNEINALQKLLNKALETYTVKIEGHIKTELRIETSTKIKQLYPSLSTALTQPTIVIKFNDRLHKQLYKTSLGWKRKTKSKDILYYLGLIDNQNKVMVRGLQILSELNKQGPDNSIRNKIALALAITGIVVKDNPIQNYIASQNFRIFNHTTRTDGGLTWLQQNAEQILKSKQTPAKLKVKLLPFASLDILPAFLTSDDEVTRQAAKDRYDELQNEST